MNKSLKVFSLHWQEALLDFCWRSWSALGVPGHRAGHAPSLADPEALILLTCAVGRRDPRLFDEMLGWISLHERLINIQRLKTLLVQDSAQPGPVVAAVAHFMGRPKSLTKWRRLAQSLSARQPPEPLFFYADGRPLPVVGRPDPAFAQAGLLRDKTTLRNHARSFDPDRPECLLLKLRALFGVNSRAEIAAFLVTHEQINAAEVARQTGYFQRTAHNTLAEMKLSGLLAVTERGGENLYSLKRAPWACFLGLPSTPPWINWPPLLSALAAVWRTTCTPNWAQQTPLQLALDLHMLFKDIAPRLQKARLVNHLTAKAGSPDEAFVQASLKDLASLLEVLKASGR